MTWVRLDDQFADSPKLERAGPSAGWLHVAALCYCARHLTDGLITWEKAARLIPQPGKRIRALIEEDVWHKEGHDCPKCPPCPPRHYLLHDYLEYQPSRAQVEAEREKERDKKRRQREAGAETRNPDGTFAGKPRGSPPGTTNGTAPGNHQGSPSVPIPSHPDPSDLRPQPTNVGTRPEHGDGDDQQQPPPDQPPATDAVLDQAASSLAWAETDRRHANGEIANPDGYQRSRTAPIRRQHEPTWRRILEHEPSSTAQQLIDAVTGHPATNGDRPDPLAGQRQALLDRAAGGLDHMRAIAHEPPPDPDIVKQALADARRAAEHPNAQGANP